MGAGFYHNSDATRSSGGSGQITRLDIHLMGADMFADLPIANTNMALTLYAVCYHFDFGPNYIRTTGICNPGVPDPSLTSRSVFEGPGNARVLLGTGEIIYAQGGLLLPRLRDSRLRIQPAAAVAWKRLDYLREAGTYWDIGSNIYLDGHHAKVSIQYSSRPIYGRKPARLQTVKVSGLSNFRSTCKSAPSG